MKKILQKYIDFILFIVLLILISIVSAKSFKRFDLTRSGVYSISNATKTTVKTLTEPLSVHVFFSENLSSPYNETYQYVKDILAEYGRIGNKNFSYKFYNMKKAENEKIASDYGLSQVRIQEAKTNEVGFKLVWMGLAIVYGPKIEVMNGLSSQEGFEYNLTTNIAKLVSTTDTLSELGSNEKVSLTLYVSEELKD
ncbi:MAG: GldG family protein, partial [Treponema sp.]|nr:GldG family protein [Treponema sp.]